MLRRDFIALTIAATAMAFSATAHAQSTPAEMPDMKKTVKACVPADGTSGNGGTVIANKGKANGGHGNCGPNTGNGGTVIGDDGEAIGGDNNTHDVAPGEGDVRLGNGGTVRGKRGNASGGNGNVVRF